MAIKYFTEAKAADLMARLERLTSSGALSWRSLDDSEYHFASTVGDYGFSIQSKDRDDLAPHVLGVFQRDDENKGRALQLMDSSEVDPSTATTMERLYEQVKRTTLKADRVADDILATLERMDSDEPPF